jgi:hypothetical protein
MIWTVQKGRTLKNRGILRHKVLGRIGIVGTWDYKTIVYVLIYDKFYLLFWIFLQQNMGFYCILIHVYKNTKKH